MSAPFVKNSSATLVVFEEATAGTEATGNGLRLPLITQNMAPTQELISSDVVNASRNPTRPYADALSVGGGFVIQPDPIGIGYLFKAALGLPTTTGAGPYTHVWKITTAQLKTLTAEAWFSDIARAWRYRGVYANRFSFDATPRGILRMPFDVIGLSMAEYAAQLDAAPFTPADVAFRLPAITLSEGGVNFQKATRFALNFDNAIELVEALNNAGIALGAAEGIGRPTGTLTTLVDASRVVGVKAGAFTESSLLATFPATDGTSSMQFTLPEIMYRINAPGVTGGTGPIPVDYAFIAYKDNDAAASALVVTLINTHASYVSIPA
jgi:hypothetical protein